MNMTTNLSEGAELRVAGSTVGIFLPEAKLRELLGERDSLRQQLEDERRKAESLAQRAEQCQRLQAELEDLKEEREEYEKALTAATRDLFPVDRDAVEAAITQAEGNSIDFSEVIREIEEICREPREDRRAG